MLLVSSTKTSMIMPQTIKVRNVRTCNNSSYQCQWPFLFEIPFIDSFSSDCVCRNFAFHVGMAIKLFLSNQRSCCLGMSTIPVHIQVAFPCPQQSLMPVQVNIAQFPHSIPAHHVGRDSDCIHENHHQKTSQTHIPRCV